jgi:hypothetical protein
LTNQSGSAEDGWMSLKTIEPNQRQTFTILTIIEKDK